ncbi:MAG: DUF4238 domain-containing protein [Ignavibacteriales bacterium]
MTAEKRQRANARKQHYVPQLLLREFDLGASGRKAQVNVFDKHEGRSYRSAVADVFAERDFNTFDSEEGVLCMEDGMATLEGLAAPVFRRVVDAQALHVLTAEDRAILDLFCALQKLRGVALRAQMVALEEDLLARLGAEADAVPQLQGAGDRERVKLSALNLIREGLAEFAHLVGVKDLVLMRAPAGAEFLLGDNPVVLHNAVDHGPYGNLGLGCLGIEIYLPVAPTLLLAFWCPSILVRQRQLHGEADQRLRRAKTLAMLGYGHAQQAARAESMMLERAEEQLRTLVAGADAGQAVRCSADNMMFYNSLQVGQAERYLVSRNGDFALARRMIADNERFRGGLRPRFI